MKIKTENLIGATLDWAVAKCERLKGDVIGAIRVGELSPSTQWHYGGPIIERESIELSRAFAPEWSAYMGGGAVKAVGYGPTPLIAAMRCYVVSKLGAEVDVPKELK